jgi:predicted Rossmann-fold nucleotide-binding protein
MKIFVPRYRHTTPSINSRILNEMFLEINELDLPEVIQSWGALDQLQNITPKAFFTTGAKDICAYPTSKNTLEPFLRRPHITLHCGAKEGSSETGPLANQLMYESGTLVARYGFNLWYGGGDAGLMGAAHKGFTDELQNRRYPDQYSVQISPAPFVYGGASTNGLRPANEGLSMNSDAAIIMPDFVTRRELLSSKCAGAFSGIGAMGTIDEITDILVHVKTGLRPTNIYILNPFVPELHRGYWDPFRELIDGFIKTGFEKSSTLDHLNFVPSPEDAMKHLMKKLDAVGQNPHIVYQEYCREMKIVPPPTQIHPAPRAAPE